MVIFPTYSSTNLYCLVTEAHLCQQPPRVASKGMAAENWTQYLLVTSQCPNHCAWTPHLQISFFHSTLRWSVAVSTIRRQSSRIAVFLQADARPMFCWPRSASTARSQVWLALPNSRFQSGGSLRITAATVWRATNVCQWPGGKEDGIRWLLRFPHSSHGEYTVSSDSSLLIYCRKFVLNSQTNMCQMPFRMSPVIIIISVC